MHANAAGVVAAERPPFDLGTHSVNDPGKHRTSHAHHHSLFNQYLKIVLFRAGRKQTGRLGKAWQVFCTAGLNFLRVRKLVEPVKSGNRVRGGKGNCGNWARNRGTGVATFDGERAAAL